jgi:competence protein ComEC
MRVTTGIVASGIALPGERARALSTRARRVPSVPILLRGAAAEARAQIDRVFLWVPVAFGMGAAIYLGLKAEPPLWPTAGAAIALGLASAVAAWRGAGRALVAALLLAAMVAAGFSVAKLRSDHVAAPIAPAGLGVVTVEGYVVDVDTPSASGPRLLIAPTFISRLAGAQLPLRARIVMPAGGFVAPGQAIRVRALLDPPPSPAAPGAYDFARDAWFEGEGAVGLARASPEIITAPPAPWRLRVLMAVNAFRWATARRLAADMNEVMGGHAGDAAGLAVAVTTSHQDWLSAEVRNDLRSAGLAHMLAIAGLHTAALSGFVFFSLRFVIAAWPWLALRVNGKKVAAAGGLIAVGAYLVLSGAHAPARRAAITASVAFTAILLDRQAVSLRSLALAALIILIADPEVVVQPGFEMSFCATAAFVALAEVWPRAARVSGLPWHLSLIQRGRDWIAGLFVVSLVAGAATGPFAIQHFNRIANFGVFANLTADLVASVLMMPALAIALLLELIGHGLAAPALFVAGGAAKVVIALGHLFATAPGAGAATTSAPQIALVISYFGILFACLWNGWLRWAGLPLAAAVAFWPRPAPPLIWIASDGADAAIAMRGQEVALRPGVRTYATDVWAQRRGLAVPADMARARGAEFDCDYWSCAARAGVRPALAIWWTRRKPKPGRLAELCAASEILVLRADAPLPGSCRDAIVLRPGDFAAGGAAEIYPTKSGWRIQWSAPLRGLRPWTANDSGG